MEVGYHADSSWSTSPTISERVCKFLPGMIWFAGNIDGIRKDGDGNIYDILFEYGDTEEWRQDKYDKNDTNVCIPSVGARFRLIKKFAGGYFLSGRIVGI